MESYPFARRSPSELDFGLLSPDRRKFPKSRRGSGIKLEADIPELNYIPATGTFVEVFQSDGPALPKALGYPVRAVCKGKLIRTGVFHNQASLDLDKVKLDSFLTRIQELPHELQDMILVCVMPFLLPPGPLHPNNGHPDHHQSVHFSGLKLSVRLIKSQGFLNKKALELLYSSRTWKLPVGDQHGLDFFHSMPKEYLAFVRSVHLEFSNADASAFWPGEWLEFF